MSGADLACGSGFTFLQNPILTIANASDAIKRGQYLVEGPGHCGECHTPRNAIGGTDKTQWLAGARAAEGKGVVPNITGGEGGIDSLVGRRTLPMRWRAASRRTSIRSAASMADVVLNTAHLECRRP